MVAQLQREDGPATATPDKRTHMRIERRADASHGAPPAFSVVAPVYNEEETLPHFYRRVVDVMEGLGEPFELVLVNDGSRDGSYGVMRELHVRDPRVRAVDFSRNFGHQVAISAGLDHARGAAVIILDSDLQDPPEVIPELVARWRKGAEVVYAQRRRRPGETRFKLLTAAASSSPSAGTSRGRRPMDEQSTL